MRLRNAVIIGTALLIGSSAVAVATSETYRQVGLIADVFERIRKDYVEEVAPAKLIEYAVNGMLRSLDPHSSYLNPKTFRAMQVQTRGEFGGLGIEVTMENGYVKVVSPIDDTPAAKAGIKAGDYITHLNGEQVQGLTLSQAVDKMRGPVNSTIKLTVRRTGEKEALIIAITRAIIQVKSVRGRVEGDAVYVRITSFNEKTARGLAKQMKKLKAELGKKYAGVVLDLRNNPGGLLDQAIAVSNAFLNRGEIVSTRGRQSEDTRRFNASKGDLAGGKPIIVLMNGGSASASEIVAGALQDHRRAVVLGVKSFGKGSVQTIIPLRGQGAIRLTTARYYTPSGRSIQALGIVPDVEVEPTKVAATAKSKNDKRSEASLRGHLSVEPETAKKAKEKAKKNGRSERAALDRQLTYALDLLRSMSIMGKRLSSAK